MTIDRTKKVLRGSAIYSEAEMWEARHNAVDIIKKYQKIEQIIKDHDVDRIPEDYWYIDKIREVIEDGNVD